MRSADDIKQLFKKAELRIHPDADERMFEDVSQARRHSLEDQPAAPDSTWREIMRSPLTKLAAAAVVVIACLIGLSLWKTTGSGIVLADVLARVEKIKAYSYKTDVSVTDPNASGDHSTRHGRVLVSEYGRKDVEEERDPNGRTTPHHEFYWLPQKRTLITLMPQQKEYLRMEFDAASARRIGNEDPRENLKELVACKYESLGRSCVEGVEVEGFRTTDPRYASSMGARQVDVKIWVDVKTELPVRSEEDLVLPQMRIRKTTYDYRWDVPAVPADFEPVIPIDYKPKAGFVTKWPTLTEETAVQGLKQGLELLGKYPETTDFPGHGSSSWPTLVTLDTPAALRLKEEVKGLTEDEKANWLVEALLPMRCFTAFYAGLRFDKKDPAYYGKTVTPKDVDKVLLRYKVSDNEYRVIFGDLHAETVSPEKLAELEKTQPK